MAAASFGANPYRRGLLRQPFVEASHVAFGDDRALVQKRHAVADGVQVVQDVAGDQHMSAGFAELAEHGDGFGAGLRIEAVQRFVQDQVRWAGGRSPTPA